MVIFHSYVSLPEGTLEIGLPWQLLLILITPTSHGSTVAFSGERQKPARVGSPDGPNTIQVRITIMIVLCNVPMCMSTYTCMNTYTYTRYIYIYTYILIYIYNIYIIYIYMGKL